MDNKILLVATILGAILLVGVICSQVQPPVADRRGEARGELVDTGRLILEQAGVPVIEEAYTLFFSTEEGYVLLSEATITVGEEYSLHIPPPKSWDVFAMILHLLIVGLLRLQ